MRTLLFFASCGGATTGNKDGRSPLAKLLCTMALREVFAAIEFVFDLSRPIR